MASTTTQSTSQTARTGTEQNPIKVQGEAAPSVTVQSQLATSTIGGKAISNSNLAQVVSDLGAAHSAHSGWVEAETQKISEWGTAEITRLLSQTKGVEERLVAEAQAKQKLMEEGHKVELARMVQQLDASKAKQLKELEDGMQRQIQAALNSSKKDINDIESEMNKRKMSLMQQAQLQTSKDIDRLSNLAVTAKLVPSTTRTVIETNTSTGTVIAVAAGGEISTGSASAQTFRSANVVAVPTAGTLTQESDVLTGSMVKNNTNQVVGEGAIVDTMTQVTQAPHVAQPLGGQRAAVDTASRSSSTTYSDSTAPRTDINRSTDSTSMPARAPIDHQTNATSNDHITTTGVVHNTGDTKKIDAAYGKPLAHNADFNKHADTTSGKHESLLSKVKHAITGEPKSTDAHKRV